LRREGPVLVIAGWFRTSSPAHQEADDARHERLARACRELAGPEWPFHSLRGDGWGFLALHAPAPGWQWPFVSGAESSSDLLTLSVGIPVGSDASNPRELATRILAEGDGGTGDIHAEVVPPFAVVVVDRRSGRAAVQQDWLGMARLFTRTNGEILAFSTRPSLIPQVDEGPAAPDPGAWAGFAATGAFCGDDSPISGVRLLRPGERLTLTSREGIWVVRGETRLTLDDIARGGHERRGHGGDDLVGLAEQVAGGIARVGASLARLYSGPIELGLSGGKDSRVIAAALVAAGLTPAVSTNTTTPAEGATAAELVERLHRRRGMRLEHTMHAGGTPAVVLTEPLLERAQRLRLAYDHQFPSTYLPRPAVALAPSEMRRPSITGAAGEILTGYWHPQDGSGCSEDVTDLLLKKICVVGDVGNLSDSAREAYAERVRSLSARAARAGLTGLDVTEYAFLDTRMRRWNTAAYHPGMVTPFLAPEVVAAAFALTPEEKIAKALHMVLLDRLVPEWAGVPFVSISTGRNRATRIWDGDGLLTIRRLATRDPGTLASMIQRDAVARAVADARTVRPASGSAKVLEQFVTLAVADAGYGTGPALPQPAELAIAHALGRLRASVRRAVPSGSRLHRFVRRVKRRVLA
jgi:hypothetical protein